MTYKLYVGLGVLAVSYLLATMPVQAADNSITVDPFYQNLKFTSAQAEVTTTIRLSNNSAVPRTFKADTIDFGGLDETGGLVFLGQNATELHKKYSLSKWLTVAISPVVVPAGQTVSVAVNVHNREDLTPGGHYGAVIFNEIATAQAGQIGLRQAITSLLFVSKLGGERYGLNLAKTDVKLSPWQLPSRLKLSFTNTGNVHVVPRGTVEVVAPNGKVVSHGVINSDSAMVLPELTRLYDVPLQQLGRIVWPGRYELRIKYRYDGQAEFTTTSRQFYFANAPLGLATGLVLLVLAAGAGWLWYGGWWKRLFR